MSNLKWTELRRLEPITEWLHSRNASDRKYLLRALRSKTGGKLGLGRRIAEFAENQDPQSVGNLLDDLFTSYGVDRPDVAIFVKDAIHRMELGPKTSGDNVLMPTKTPPPQVERPQMPQSQPNSLLRLNQTVGVPNQTLNANEKVQSGPPVTPTKTPTPTPPAGPGAPVAPAAPTAPPVQDEDIISKRLPQDPSQHELIQMLAFDATPKDVAPNDKQIVQNDVMFDMFSHVPEGFGNGVNNKLYRMDVNHTHKIRYQNPLYYPRNYEGPEYGLTPLPYQWKNQMDDATIETYTKQLAREALSKLQANQIKHPTSCLNGNDVHDSISSKGLPSYKKSIFQKQIDNVTKMYPTKFTIKRKLEDTMTSLFDPQIDPTQLSVEKPFVQNTLRSNLALQTIHGNDWML